MRWRPFTIPNLISVIRLACIPLFLWMLFSKDDRWGAALLLGGLGASDWVDGFIARRFDQVSELGKILDPTADRLMLLVGIFAIMIDGSVPIWIGVLALVREGLVAVAAVLLAVLGAQRIDVTWWGKTGTFMLMFAFPFFLAGNSDIGIASAFEAGAWICVLIGLPIHYYSAFGYAPAARDALRAGRSARHIRAEAAGQEANR
ncbi:MAG: CDP-alcohol phosphatidyltransferase family protein [Actinomycetota bacterium]|jgi:cardiolipin synthase (CMP-forming)|nr:CDP-alcohol phosphatidyltransferase family protein [Actinomycetota bacterium]